MSADLNFLDPDLSVQWDITEEAFKWLPEVTSEDNQSEQERFRLLLGNWAWKEKELIVTIDTVVEVHDQSYLYVEMKRKCVLSLEACHTTVANWDTPGSTLLGYFHTHPGAPEYSWWPSDKDQSTWIGHYSDKVLVPTLPFIFMIGGSLLKGQTGYEAYRAIVRDDVWSIHRIKSTKG